MLLHVTVEASPRPPAASSSAMFDFALTRSFPALQKFRSSPAADDVHFTIKYFPYQLYPEASKEGEDKYEW